MGEKSEPHEIQEAEIIGENPSRKYEKSSRNNSRKSSRKSQQKFREQKIAPAGRADGFNDFAKIWRVSKIAIILILILVVCVVALVLKFLVGVIGWLLQFVIVVAAVWLVGWLIYSFAKGKK